MKLTESEFRETLEKAKVPVVADFYANWCGPCRTFGPIFREAAEKLAPKFSLCMVDIDEASTLAEEVGVRVIPTVMVFDDTRVVATHEGGFESVKDLVTFLRQFQ